MFGFGKKKDKVEPVLADVPVEAPAAPAVEIQPAGFWLRAVALIVDYGVLFILLAVMMTAAASAGGEDLAGPAYWLWVVITFFYWPVMESTARRGTVGKMALGLVVGDIDGGGLSFVRSLLRNLAKIISSIPLGIGFLLAAFTARKQALHDLITKAVVMRKGPGSFARALVVLVAGIALIVVGSTLTSDLMMGAVMKDMEAMMGGGVAQPPPAKPAVKPMAKPVAKPAAPAPATAPAPAPATAPAPQAQLPAQAPAVKPAPTPVQVAQAPAAPKPAPEAKPAAPQPAAPQATAPKPAPAAAAKPSATPEAAMKPEPAPAPPKPATPATPAAPATAAAKPEPMKVAAAPKPEPAAAKPAPAPDPAPRAPAEPVVPLARLSIPAQPGPRFNDVMTAVLYRDRETVSQLVSLGRWLDKRDSNRLTPLMVAASMGDAEMVSLLLERGARADLQAPGGATALDFALERGDAPTTQLLQRWAPR